MSDVNPPRLRVSDADRSLVAAQLADAYAEGKLTRDEFDERSSQAMVAKFDTDLVPLVGDLSSGVALTPAPHPSRAVITPGATGRSSAVAIFGGYQLNGPWTIAPQLHLINVFGGGDVDLREVVFTSDEVIINVYCTFGGCSIIVPPDARVRSEGIGIFGGFGDNQRGAVPEAERTGPLIRVRGFALFGGANIERKARSDS